MHTCTLAPAMVLRSTNMMIRQLCRVREVDGSDTVSSIHSREGPCDGSNRGAMLVRMDIDSNKLF